MDAADVSQHGDRPCRAHPVPDRSRVLDAAQPAPRVHVRALLTPMTDVELIAWAAGYLAGWDRGTDPDNLEWFDRTEQIKEAFRRSESAGRRKAWDAAVLRGENPTPHETETA